MIQGPRGRSGKDSDLIPIRTLAIVTASVVVTLPVGLCSWWAAKQTLSPMAALAVTLIAMLATFGRSVTFLHGRVG